jgi:hypothetical protein
MSMSWSAAGRGLPAGPQRFEGDGRSFEDIAADRLSKPNDADELTGVQS